MEYDVLLGWTDVLMLDPSTLASGIDVAKRVRDECLPFLPDLKQSFIAQCYNISGRLHMLAKWDEVVKWTSFIIEACEKEPLDALVDLREKALVLLCDAYIALHDDAKSLLCLQLCSHPNTTPIQFLYLKYYLLLQNTEKALSTMEKLNALAGENDQATHLDAIRLLCEASVNSSSSSNSTATSTASNTSSTTSGTTSSTIGNHTVTNEACQRMSGPILPLRRSMTEVVETHPSWKAAVRVTFLCCYLHSPVLCNQSLELLDACLEGARELAR